MDLSNKTNDEIRNLAEQADDKDTLQQIADKIKVKYSGNTGIETLRTNILEKLMEDSEDEIKSEPKKKLVSDPKPVSELPKNILETLDHFDPQYTEAERRLIIRAKSLKLHRVRISNLDPADAALPGEIFTVYNKYTGKVSKYIPYGEENEHGYHVPEILLNSLKNKTYNMRREIKRPGSSFGIKQYKTVTMRKFSIEYLDALSDEELDNLAKDQKARGAIDPED